MTNERPQFRVIDANASDEEVAAIIGALATLTPAAAADNEQSELSMWVAASRLTSRRTGLSRGDWRMSGRIGRRSRA